MASSNNKGFMMTKNIELLDKKHYIGKVQTFRNFYVNEDNKEVYELLKNYPNEIKKYNPIVIKGKLGSGKTHLLNAFKNRHSDGYNIKIVNCFDFAYDMTDSIIHQTMGSFYKSYNSFDILCFENLEHLIHKETIQDTLYNIIDKFIRNDKQIIIAMNNCMLIPKLLSKISFGVEYSLSEQKN